MPVAHRQHRSSRMRLCGVACICIVASICAPQIVDLCQGQTLVRNSEKNLGVVEQGKIVAHRFEVWNLSLRTITIAQVVPSCTCSVTKVDSYTVRPLHRSVITMRVDTERVGLGRNAKGVSVYLAGGKKLVPYVVFNVVKKRSPQNRAL